MYLRQPARAHGARARTVEPVSKQTGHLDDDRRRATPGRAAAASGWVRAALLAVLVLLTSGLVGALSAAPASAHARFVGSDPVQGAVLDELPAVVVMSYSEQIAPQFVDTAVVPPGGEPQAADATVDGVDVTVDVAGAVSDPVAGEWQVVARVVSTDGHPVEHTTTFVLQAQPEPAPGATAEPAPSAAAASPTTGATSEPVAEQVPEPVSDAATVSADPVASIADELPGWAGVLVVLALIGAGVAAVVLHLRRRPPGD
jgi:copper resistance protein C